MPCTPPPTDPKVTNRTFKSRMAGSGLKLFIRLKNSARNSNERFSVNRNDLLSEKSTVPMPGRRTEAVRGVARAVGGGCRGAVGGVGLSHRAAPAPHRDRARCSGLYAGDQLRELDEVAAVERQFHDLAGIDSVPTLAFSVCSTAADA